MIPGGGPSSFYDTIPRGMNTIYTGLTNQENQKDEEIDQPDRPNRMQKFTEALDKSLKYKEQKELDAEIGAKTDKDKDSAAATQKGFKVSPDTTVLSGYTDPGITLAGQKGRTFGGLIGTVVGAGIGLANPAIGAQLGASIGSKAGSYF